jgi:hypothetical protein
MAGPVSGGIFANPESQMWHGERAAITGLLAERRPSLSIELGTARGGSLGMIAFYSGHVHSFDLTLQIERDRHPNVTFHIGDSHELLPRVLAELAASGERIGFVLVDGDHTPEGVRRDLIALLDSDASSNGVIVLHDTGNEAVRRGIESVPFAQYSRVEMVELDFVPAHPVQGRLVTPWGGLGLIVLAEGREGLGALPESSATRGVFWIVRELKRRARHTLALALRRLGLHPSQLRARRAAGRRR